MTELVDNEFGVEYKQIAIRKLRIFRVGAQCSSSISGFRVHGPRGTTSGGTTTVST